MVGKTDLKWLREHGFRKERNKLQWYTNATDADTWKPGMAPYFEIEVVFNEPNECWHARVSVHKEQADPSLIFMPKSKRDEWGVPAHWNEDDWLDFPLGYSIGWKTAELAVSQAVQRACGFAKFLLDKNYYNIKDLEQDFQWNKNDGE